MRLFSIGILALLLSSCGAQSTLTLIKNMTVAPTPDSKIKLYIGEEKDMGDSYRERLKTYSLASIKDRMTKSLQQPEVRYNILEPNGDVTWTGKMANPFSIVTDSTEADVVISIVIEGFGYGKQDDMERLFGNWAVFGALGAMLTETGPRGYLMASCYATERVSGKVIHSFDGLGTSGVNTAHRVALEDALEMGNEEAVLNLLASSQF